MNISPSTISFRCEGKCECKKPEMTVIDGAPATGPVVEAPYPYNGTEFPDGSSFTKDRKYQPATPKCCGEKLNVEG